MLLFYTWGLLDLNKHFLRKLINLITYLAKVTFIQSFVLSYLLMELF